MNESPFYNLKDYYKSMNDEFFLLKDRIRNLIGRDHWYTDGAHKESILKKIIKRFLPEKYLVGSGFIISSLERGITKSSTEIDVLILNRTSPTIFKDEDFYIVSKHAVEGIIEVKTKLPNRDSLSKILIKLDQNARFLEKKSFENKFTGLFVYESGYRALNGIRQNLRNYIDNSERLVKYITIGEDLFIRLRDNRHEYIGYKLENLAFIYFISNLLSRLCGNKMDFKLHYPTPKNHKLFSIPIFE